MTEIHPDSALGQLIEIDKTVGGCRLNSSPEDTRI